MPNKKLQLQQELQALNTIYATTDMPYSEYLAHKKIIEDELKEVQKNDD